MSTDDELHSFEHTIGKAEEFSRNWRYGDLLVAYDNVPTKGLEEALMKIDSQGEYATDSGAHIPLEQVRLAFDRFANGDARIGSVPRGDDPDLRRLTEVTTWKHEIADAEYTEKNTGLFASPDYIRMAKPRIRLFGSRDTDPGVKVTVNAKAQVVFFGSDPDNMRKFNDARNASQNMQTIILHHKKPEGGSGTKLGPVDGIQFPLREVDRAMTREKLLEQGFSRREIAVIAAVVTMNRELDKQYVDKPKVVIVLQNGEKVDMPYEIPQ